MNDNEQFNTRHLKMRCPTSLRSVECTLNSRATVLKHIIPHQCGGLTNYGVLPRYLQRAFFQRLCVFFNTLLYYLYIINKLIISFATRTIHVQQGNQRWQIPRPAPCQCLATFTLLKSKKKCYFFVTSFLCSLEFLLIDTATQEVPMKTFERNCHSSF